ncbi:MAG TPA: MBL fold metallo-hydrolase [Syntrophomonadaceae bacterium]|nr:MBL fold metallo-hydrolase [Syntrophomonadaceae bacterium]
MAKLTFLGGVGTVTGSCYLLETDRLKILVDCGMFQGRRELRMLNYRNPLVAPQSIDYILLTHAHIDHSGLIPRFYKQGFRGKVLATRATHHLCKVMLPDSGHIQEMEAEWESRKAKRRGERAQLPLYTAADALECLRLFEGVPYEQEVSLNDAVRLRFLDAGHILGSAIIEVWVRENGKEMKIVFSGDLGKTGTAILRDPTYIAEADYALIESTYGDRFHEPIAGEAARLKEIVLETVKNKGNVVIPAFAVERTQEILYELNNMIETKQVPPIPVYIDSPLAVSATEIFRNCQDCYDEAARQLLQSGDDPFNFPGLTFVRTTEESKALNNLPGSKIIISASGMCDAGRIKHHLKHNLWRPECAVVFVGFQGEGTLGRRILDGEKKVKILGEIINVAAKIYSLQGFSAHADQTGLLDWVSHFTTKPQRLFVVHGEAPASRTLAGLIEQKFAIPTVIPQMGEEYVLMPTGAELTRVAAAFPAAAANTRQQLLLALTRLEQKIAALKEQLLLPVRANGEEAVLEKLIQDIEDKIDEAEQKAANK